MESKGALDRIDARGAANSALGVTANVGNPGATDTGWMSQELMADVRRWTLLGKPACRRTSQPVAFSGMLAQAAGSTGNCFTATVASSNPVFHGMIYSPGCPVFRNDDGALLECSVSR